MWIFVVGICLSEHAYLSSHILPFLSLSPCFPSVIRLSSLSSCGDTSSRAQCFSVETGRPPGLSQPSKPDSRPSWPRTWRQAREKQLLPPIFFKQHTIIRLATHLESKTLFFFYNNSRSQEFHAAFNRKQTPHHPCQCN